MLVKSFVIGAISLDATTEATTKYGESSIDEFIKYKYLTGKLPNGNLIGSLSTYLGGDKVREIVFVVTPNGDIEFIGYSPAKKSRILREREINFILATCLEYKVFVKEFDKYDVLYHTFKLIDLKKIFE